MAVKTLRISLSDEEWALVEERAETFGERPLGGRWSKSERQGLAIAALMHEGLARQREKRDAYGLPINEQMTTAGGAA